MIAATQELCNHKETVLNSSCSSIPTNVSATETDNGPAMEFHPVAALFRMMTDDELEALRLDIAANGQREDILLAQHEGVWKIADGRNRYVACQAVGVEPRFREWNGVGDLTAIVVSLNLKRRHLSQSQLAMVAAKLSNMERGRPQSNPSSEGFISQTSAAKSFNISVASVERAAKVLRDGDPETIEAVEQGEMSVSIAADVATLSPAEQQRIVRQSKELKKAGRRSHKRVILELKTQSLRQTAKGLGTCLYCNPEIAWDDNRVSAFAQRVEQRAKEAVKAGRAQIDYSPFFESIAFEIEEERRAESARSNYEKIFAVIDAGSGGDTIQCAEKTDIQRITKIPWTEFNDLIANMLDLRMIEIVKQGGKTDGARGARKTLFRRAAAPLGDLEYELDPAEDDDQEDVYYDRSWD